MFAYGRLGVNLPHSSYELFRLGRRVGRWAMKPGDLVFFYGAGHVGIYLGHSRFVQATHSGDHVRISSLKRLRGRVRRRAPAPGGGPARVDCAAPCATISASPRP